MKLLCISNGHGEDAIALHILLAMRSQRPDVELFALPVSGEGKAYGRADVPLIGPARSLPSGGFLNRDATQLARDVRQGLISLTRSQLAAIKRWSGEGDFILAVGDIVPLLMAYRSGLPYAFLGTAKSEYWLKDESGKLPKALASGFWHRFEGWSGSVYLPWERWLMARSQCKKVFARDEFTAKTLEEMSIPAVYAGNPMMDGLAATGRLEGAIAPLLAAAPATASSPETSRATALYASKQRRDTIPLTVTLLPGSRLPEAYENWERILRAVSSLCDTFWRRALIFLAAIAPSLSMEPLQSRLKDAGWTLKGQEPYLTYGKQNASLLLVSDAYSDCLHAARVAIATAGTATEQFVGLGKPAIALPGEGPQFTKAFATVQAKMLGPSVLMVEQPEKVGSAIAKVLGDPDLLQLIYQNGKRRMGEAGAGERIASQVLDLLVD